MVNYDRKVNKWDKSLQLGNGLIDWQTFNVILPASERLMKFTKPSRPQMPHKPLDYTGPDFQNTEAVHGYGKPTTYSYDMSIGITKVFDPTTGVLISAYRHDKFKNFGVDGYSLKTDQGVQELNRKLPVYTAITLVPKMPFVSTITRFQLTVSVGTWKEIDISPITDSVGPATPRSLNYNAKYP
jgi:hypothetical protein